MNKTAKVDLKAVQEIMGDRAYTGKELCAMFGFSLKPTFLTQGSTDI